jgi:hypothetical protein
LRTYGTPVLSKVVFLPTFCLYEAITFSIKSNVFLCIIQTQYKRRYGKTAGVLFALNIAQTISFWLCDSILISKTKAVASQTGELV